MSDFSSSNRSLVKEKETERETEREREREREREEGSRVRNTPSSLCNDAIALRSPHM